MTIRNQIDENLIHNENQITEGKNKLRAKIRVLEDQLNTLHDKEIKIAEKMHLVQDIIQVGNQIMSQSVTLGNLMMKLMEKF